MFCTHFCLVKLHLLTSLEAERGDNIRSTLHPQVTKVLSDAGVMDSYSAPLKPGKLFFAEKPSLDQSFKRECASKFTTCFANAHSLQSELDF